VEVLRELGGNGCESGWDSLEWKWSLWRWVGIGVISGPRWVSTLHVSGVLCLASRVMRLVAVKTYPCPASLPVGTSAWQRPSLSPVVSVWKVLLRTIFVWDSSAVLRYHLAGLYLTGGSGGFDPPQDVADPPESSAEPLWGGSTLTLLRTPDSIFLLNQYIYVRRLRLYRDRRDLI